MKNFLIISIVFVTILNINIQAKALELFKIKGETYTTLNFQLPKYKLSENTYVDNVNKIKQFVQHKLIYEEIILGSKEYSKIKKEIKKNLELYELKNKSKLLEIEKIEIAMFLWKEQVKKEFVISSKTVEKFYKENQDLFLFNKSIKSYYVFSDNLEDLKYVINSLTFTYDKKAMIFKLSKDRNNNQSPYLGWRDENNFYTTFGNKDLFSYLWSLDKGDVTQREIYLPKYKKYIVFLLDGKKEPFLRKLKLAYSDIEIMLRNKLFNRRLNIELQKIEKIKIEWNIKNIKGISKK